MVRRYSYFLLVAIGLQSPVWGQSQRDFSTLNDYGDETVQTFVAESTQAIAAVRLVIRAHGLGNDVTVHIRDLLPNGTLSPILLASGVLDNQLLTPSAAWQMIEFASPFQMVLGNDYGMVINQFGSGGGNFVDYGASLAAPYLAGSLQYEYPVGAVLGPISPASDLAFELVGIPEPSALTLLCLGSVCLLRRRKAGGRLTSAGRFDNC